MRQLTRKKQNVKKPQLLRENSRQAAYYLRPSESPNFVGQGQIKAEKNVAGQMVSRMSFPTSYTDPNLLRRTETRGDGPSRTFNYANASFTWTDFKNQPFTAGP
jgi:hypothetical protein